MEVMFRWEYGLVGGNVCVPVMGMFRVGLGLGGLRSSMSLSEPSSSGMSMSESSSLAVATKGMKYMTLKDCETEIEGFHFVMTVCES